MDAKELDTALWAACSKAGESFTWDTVDIVGDPRYGIEHVAAILQAKDGSRFVLSITRMKASDSDNT